MYEGGKGFSIYLAALHSCNAEKLAHMAIAIRDGYAGFTETCAVCLHVWVDGSEFRMSLIDADLSPWKAETYLGRIIGREEALNNPLIENFFHVADHINVDNPKINEYFDG